MSVVPVEGYRECARRREDCIHWRIQRNVIRSTLPVPQLWAGRSYGASSASSVPGYVHVQCLVPDVFDSWLWLVNVDLGVVTERAQIQTVL